jgi:hypothetical protein
MRFLTNFGCLYQAGGGGGTGVDDFASPAPTTRGGRVVDCVNCRLPYLRRIDWVDGGLE